MYKQELINKINEIDNIYKYSIKGGTAMFNKEYPNLLNLINDNTKEIQIYSNNKKLVAKLLYLKKYNGEINNLTQNDKIMIYDYKINDFKTPYLNSTQKQWDVCKLDLNKINDLYDKEETMLLLKDKYKIYLGKSGNRKLLRDNKKLYLSLYHHTSNLDNLNKNLNKFSMRLHILVNNVNVICETHKTHKFWKFNCGEFKICCGKCEPKYPSLDWFKKTYGDNWEYYNNIRKESVKKNKTNSLDWFKSRYGIIVGNLKYHEYVEKKMNYLCELKANKYSKISQDLFWEVHKSITNKDNIYFFELNTEYVIRIPEKYNYDKTVMIVDFIQNNKIIEYNGNYWHNTNNDDIRTKILNDLGYDVMIVTSDEYNRNKKNNDIVVKCVKFLQCE